MNSKDLTNKNSNISKIVDIILVVSIISECMFFCINSLLGYKYIGSESSITYKVYLAFLTTFNILILLFSFIKKSKMPVRYYFMIKIPIVFSIFATITSLFYQESNSNAEHTIFYILIWQTTAILAAINIKRRNNFICIIKWFDIGMLICTIGLLRAIINSNVISSTMDTIGGATYQAASYYAAFAFGLNLFQLVGDGEYTFKYLTYKFFKIIRMVLLLLQVLITILSGGRGGIILILTYMLYFTWSCNKWNIISKRKMYSIVFISIFAVFFGYSMLMQNEVFQVRLARIFSYITGGRLDFSQTSGRDVIYKSFIEAILQKPILGRGILSYYYVFDRYPHNIFLEILFEGGLCYLSLWIFIAVALIVNLHRNFHEEIEKTFMKVLALYPCVFLMFSGSYIINPLFWFVLTWAILKSKK